ncbi:Response regulator PleD (plasmid) [Aquisphaera giovannonii]|uniref:diguanylate cyclase n=1 Tax=Aquisphaera giovannonii TaxID=406548 RepID=A0A5B9WFU2_9BACT|nr:diguanylate cyclase [Aquisphaera giovannonii]QEH39333.1 Response regulator PleD [Aquisphaera giovannonii]
MSGLAIAAVDAGAQDYLIKGRASPDMLARSIRHALRRKRLEVELERQNSRLVALASSDALTGLYKRPSPAPGGCWAPAHGAARPLSAVLLDIDRFKSYNDAFGHPAGDEILGRVGEILRAECRPHDLAARYGGEEFVVLLPTPTPGRPWPSPSDSGPRSRRFPGRCGP